MEKSGSDKITSTDRDTDINEELIQGSIDEEQTCIRISVLKGIISLLSSKDNSDDICKKSDDIQEAPGTGDQVENVVAEGNITDSSCVEYNVELRVEKESEEKYMGEEDKVVRKFVEEKSDIKSNEGKEGRGEMQETEQTAGGSEIIEQSELKESEKTEEVDSDINEPGLEARQEVCKINEEPLVENQIQESNKTMELCKISVAERR